MFVPAIPRKVDRALTAAAVLAALAVVTWALRRPRPDGRFHVRFRKASSRRSRPRRCRRTSRMTRSSPSGTRSIWKPSRSRGSATAAAARTAAHGGTAFRRCVERRQSGARRRQELQRLLLRRHAVLGSGSIVVRVEEHHALAEALTSARTARRGPESVAAGVRGVLEPRVLAEERQPNGADRPIALLADDDLGGALVLRLGVVDLVAIDEDDDVCILFNGARVVADDAVREPARRARNGQVEDFFLAADSMATTRSQ